MKFLLAVVVVAGIALVVHSRGKAAEEHRFASVASAIAGRPVHVHCQGFLGATIDVTAESGTVEFDAAGKPADVTNLKRPICDALDRFPHDIRGADFACLPQPLTCSRRVLEDAVAVHVLAHESWHLHGEMNEARTECFALQSTSYAAQRFGADPTQGQQIAELILARVYPNMPTEYVTGDCVDRGPLDLRPASSTWP